MTLLPAILLLLGISCTAYNPSAFVSYDTLNPGPEVRKNPVGTVTVVVILDSEGAILYESTIWTDQELEDGKAYFIVDEYFMTHYRELWETVKKLRNLVK